MSRRGRVMVEFDILGLNILRIFRSDGAASVAQAQNDAGSRRNVFEYPRKDAVEKLRRQIFERSQGKCESCSKAITWQTMEMHERVPRGKGGEQSMENCEASCYSCHQGPMGHHQNHLLRSGK